MVSYIQLWIVHVSTSCVCVYFLDAPAIKSADVGVAMGQAGTEITKQAADLVLLNDNFTTIVSAVEEGRHVFDNILKFIVYLLSCNGSEIFLMLTCSIANIETPFTVMMILWANIIGTLPMTPFLYHPCLLLIIIHV